MQTKLGLANSDDQLTRALYDELLTELRLRVLSGFEEVNFRVEESVGLHPS